jgi:hypothetical protein
MDSFGAQVVKTMLFRSRRVLQQVKIVDLRTNLFLLLPHSHAALNQ